MVVGRGVGRGVAETAGVVGGEAVGLGAGVPVEMGVEMGVGLGVTPCCLQAVAARKPAASKVTARMKTTTEKQRLTLFILTLGRSRNQLRPSKGVC